MDSKTLGILEYPKILERLARHTTFAAGRELALKTRPAASLERARELQAETAAARLILTKHPEITLRGVRDIRETITAARRGFILEPRALLDLRATLARARDLRRQFTRLHEEAPPLAEIAARLPGPLGLVDAISKAISDEGEILDSASPRLAGLRTDLALGRQRLVRRLERMVRDPAISPLLQEPIVTQRDGRYVLPLKADFKGRLPGIVHDRSSSGATLFVEPLAVVEINNRLRELESEIEQEIRRILAELSRRVATHADTLEEMTRTLAVLDVIFARAYLAEEMDAAEPKLVPFRRPHSLPAEGDQPPITHPGSTLRLLGARHPLLPADKVVPLDIALDEDTFAVVVTGPNTGGKTVTLKTVGLLAAMAQSGMQIPAESGSALSVYENIFADIGDEQSIEQSLSTFSGHMRNIVRILKRADRRSLVLLDELGSGTDPQEGAALARAILDTLVRRGITTLVATHYPELKLYAHATPGVVNASMEFDPRSLKPTYRLSMGLPGRSNALEIARRLGLPQEIVEAARAGFQPSELKADALLDEIHRQRRIARRERRRAERARRRAEALRARLAKRLAEIEDERRAVLDSARAEAAEQIAALQQEIKNLRRRLRKLSPPEQFIAAQPEIQSVEEAARELEKQADEAFAEVQEQTAPAPVAPPPPLAPGAKVFVERLGAEGVVAALLPETEEAEVMLGSLRMRTPVKGLRVLAPAPEEPTPQEEGSLRLPPVESPGMELHLRGMPVDEALEALERYLDQAYLAGLPFVRIVHGKGTGKLRAAVRDALSRHPHVRSWEPGLPAEGGEGVTVAKLETD